jgi:hypothetical protein
MTASGLDICDVTYTVYNEIRRVEAAVSKRFFVLPPYDMRLHLGRLLAGAEGTDVTFEVAAKTNVAHSYILDARSSFFMAQLFAPMKKKTLACMRIEDMEARCLGPCPTSSTPTWCLRWTTTTKMLMMIRWPYGSAFTRSGRQIKHG